MDGQRFANHTESEILKKRAQIIPQNTQKANQKSARTFRAYLAEKRQAIQFEKYSPERLNETLSFFYLDARKPDGELYKSTSMENFRHNLNRYLKAPPHLARFEIIKDGAFVEANESFKTAMSEIKRAGKGNIKHYPEIEEEEDLLRLYSSVYMNPYTPCGLANKVQFDVRLYFCRRSGENIHGMKKDTFVVETAPSTGLRYAKKNRGELTKNRRAQEKEGYGGVMPEINNADACPVKSFVKYVSKLHSDLDSLWQRPLGSFLPEDPVWYCISTIGHDTLSSFMTKLTRAAKLSMIYTNHSVRVTGATILHRNNFSPAQIMLVTGHASASSLAVYQRVKDPEKVTMGKAITGALLPSNQLTIADSARPLPLSPVHMPADDSSDSQLVVGEGVQHMTAVDWDQFFSEPMEMTPQAKPLNISNSLVNSTHAFRIVQLVKLR